MYGHYITTIKMLISHNKNQQKNHSEANGFSFYASIELSIMPVQNSLSMIPMKSWGRCRNR